MMNGRMYSEVPGFEGTQSISASTVALTALTNSSSSIGGMHMRSLVRLRRCAFI